MPFVTQGKTNWKFLLIVIVLAVIVGGGALWYVKRPEKPYQPPEIKKPEKVLEEKCKDIQDLVKQAKCYADLAKETKDENYCEKIEIPEAPEVLANCYNELAILKNDSSLCWKIETASLSSSCWEYFGMKDWKTYRNEKYGFEIKYPEYLEITHPYGEADTRFVKGKELYYSVTVSELSGLIVYKGETVSIASLDAKDLLIIDLTQRCKELDPNEITWESIKMGGIDGFQANSRDECAKQYTPWSRIIKNDRSYSLSFWEGSIKEYNQMLSTFRFKELSLEDCLKMEGYKEQGCYIEVAVGERDETICANLWEIYRDICYERVATIKKDPNICSGIIDRRYLGHKDDCYVDVAVIKQDFLICERVQDQVYKSWCIKTIQKQSFSPEEVVVRFFHEYLYKGVTLEESISITKEYQQKIAKILEGGTMVDPVIFAQAEPTQGIIVEKAEISEKTASLITTLKYDITTHNLKVELLLIDDEWKIDDIHMAE